MIITDYPKEIKAFYMRMNDDNKTPDFLVWAQGDKNGAPLQRIQIVKGWIDMNSGTPYEKIYDVACSDGMIVDPITNRCPDNGARVNINDCSISQNVGATELKSIWIDPDFDSTVNKVPTEDTKVSGGALIGTRLRHFLSSFGLSSIFNI